MIAFEFDRTKMRRKLTMYSALLIGWAVSVALLYNWVIPYTKSISCTRYIVMVVVLLAFGNFLEYLRWIGIFGRGLRRQGKALVVNNLGIMDNATDYTLGQLTWAEIEKMYPWNRTTRLFGNRWQKMPVICRERGIVIYLKEGVSLQTRLQSKSWIRRSSFEAEWSQGKRWLFISESLLDTPADELMRRLNAFYVAQVRTSALCITC